MSSRKEQKEALRQERVAREKAAAEAAARRRRYMIGGGVIALAAAVVLVVVLVAGGGSSKTGAATVAGSNKGTGGSGTQAGLETGAAPWPAEYSFLAQRLAGYNFPEQSDVGYHEHAKLFVYVNGRNEPVPADFGIDPQGRFIAPLHTHDGTGIIHMESAAPYPFTLGETVDIWGVKFSDSQLGGYRAGNGNVLQLWVNGKQVADPVNYKIKPHDVMILAYGKPGSFPTKKAYSFPAGV